MKIIKEQLHSQILESPITFGSLSKNITFIHYLNKPKTMLEWKLLAMLDKNSEIVHSCEYNPYNQLLFRELFDIYIDEFY